MNNLFLTKQAALDSGVQGEVYIGHKNIHSVCKINGDIITYVYTRSNWEPEVSYLVTINWGDNKEGMPEETQTFLKDTLQGAKDTKNFMEAISKDCTVEIIKVQKSKVVL